MGTRPEPSVIVSSLSDVISVNRASAFTLGATFKALPDKETGFSASRADHRSSPYSYMHHAWSLGTRETQFPDTHMCAFVCYVE